MHGAALAWSLVMPPGTALLELWPQPNMWRLYEHTAQWAGLAYRLAPLLVHSLESCTLLSHYLIHTRHVLP